MLKSSQHNYETRLSTGALKRKTIYDTSDISDNDYSDKESDDLDENEFHEDECKSLTKDKVKYYQFLNKVFPSNYSKLKITELKRQRLSSPLKIKTGNKFEFNQNNINDKIYNEDDDDDEEDDEDGEDDEDDEQDGLLNNKNVSYDNLKQLFNSGSNKNINIIVNLKHGKNNIFNNDNDNNNPFVIDNFYDAEEDEEDEEDEDEEDEEDEEEEKYKKQPKKSKGLTKSKSLENNVIENVKDKKIAHVSKSIANKNYKKFTKFLEDKDDESEYFKKKLSRSDQEYAIAKIEALKNITSIETPYLIHLINLDIPDNYKACALKKINMLRAMGGGFGSSEYYKIKSWVDSFIKIPFNKYNNLPITFADGIDKCHDFMADAKKTLDSVVYGLDDAKIQIMQLIGLWLVNPNAVGSAIAIKGPMGTGKTTLIKDGISKILNRPFALVALGGCGDSGYLDGHDYTYEGSKYGKIIDILIQCGSMNPVILFDELDKISDSPKGDEITGVLTHLTDTTQNNNFTDKYMSEISLDMSKALYIFSYNDESRVNPILKDRMYKIETKGYKTKDKLTISKDYLLPKICEQAKFQKEDIVFNDDILEYIINDFTNKEFGVRNLKRCLEIIYTKLNLYRLMKPDINLFETSMNLKEKVVFPVTLTRGIIDKLINKAKGHDIPFGMYN